jgi:DNA-binding winged helix-turn-helix (wHTH) protein
MPPDTKATILRFGVFELDLEAQRLLRAGRAIRVQPQPFKLLCLLAENGGKVVTRDEIRAALWSGDTFVDFDQGVNFAISQLREALGDSAERPVYIETVPKRGYRFLAPVTSIREEEPPSLETPTQRLSKVMWANISELRIAEQRRELRWRQLKRAAIIVAIVVAVLAAAALVAIFLI